MNTTEEKMVTLEMLKNLNADFQSKRNEGSKPKRPYKRQTKANRVRKLLASGMSVADITAKIKVTPSYVYHIRWYDNKAAGIGSLRKPKIKVEETLGTDQIPYVQCTDPAHNACLNPVVAAHTPGSPAYVFKIEEQARPPRKPTFWQRVRDFVGL
jgi:hypothetical protein